MSYHALLARMKLDSTSGLGMFLRHSLSGLQYARMAGGKGEGEDRATSV